MSYPDENIRNSVVHPQNNTGKGIDNTMSTSEGLKHEMITGECGKTRKECKARPGQGGILMLYQGISTLP